jgi:hypothetical protein
MDVAVIHSQTLSTEPLEMPYICEEEQLNQWKLQQSLINYLKEQTDSPIKE